MRRTLAALFAVALLAVGCTPGGQAPEPEPSGTVRPDNLPDAAPQAEEVVDALNANDLTTLRTVEGGSTAQADLTTIFAGMDGIYPSFTLGDIEYTQDTATATLQVDYPNLGTAGWHYSTRASFRLSGDTWVFDWEPSVIAPELTSETRLRHIQTESKRQAINDSTGLALVEERSLYEVGLNKGAITEAEWASSALEIATLLGVDVADFQAKVEANGPQAFVVATTIAQENIPAAVSDVPGSLVNEVSAVVGPSDTFAASLLGAVGQPTQKMIDDSDGKLSSLDRVGLSGLQARYDADLRGVPARRVEMVGRSGVEDQGITVLFQQDASVGKPITLSLNRELQTKAESVLSTQTGLATLVVIDTQTGGVLAAAQSPSAGTYPYATYGKYAPGSTFKVATALAMLRAGSTPTSTVQCLSTLQVGTYTFGNYSSYPSSALGAVSLTDAFKYSCNTVFAGATGVTGDLLHSAAGSLGVGTDYDAGFTANFGTVEPGNAIDLAASKIGQGQVTMSPLGMAAVAASVASSQTVIPWLVQGHQAESTAAPLTAAEAQQLQTMMTATVDSGTGTRLKGIMTGAKSGTAEWGEAGAQQTHAWMIAYNDRYAVSAFVEVGDSGGTTAAPLIVQLFS
ncbi:Cell division protein FtsI/penicillin-binding protein 2 [Tessaracoccus bendigoensis DSM 12906]|uniref:Beta-lactamase n=1 Tax=Tessaracoccus bendigoensis DSM 12906 TaxID=1123357 RepID=A0A1M6B6T5_9ACTN|nr:penicillin-binding transpeptidase domain-containing protein [Tessaracoccus bendigoensis]SHI44451.1 Cell division protein FtsI/penicillin-binding protein 2 [Tessaracoccus bendigoensis DSM 12906]